MDARQTYDLYQFGKKIGQTTVSIIQGHKIADNHKSDVEALLNAAAKDGVNLVINCGLRLQEEQIKLRLQNIKDKTKVKSDGKGGLIWIDEEAEKIIMTYQSSYFSPATGLPGFSNHQNGRAVDYNATPKEYAWLVKNAHALGWVRTVQSERWHWEYLPLENNMFAYVTKDHPTWDGLV